MDERCPNCGANLNRQFFIGVGSGFGGWGWHPWGHHGWGWGHHGWGWGHHGWGWGHHGWGWRNQHGWSDPGWYRNEWE